ncbi:hypothetical protein PROFUN_00103 [Planoprotostelium fungivorum]|uniref:PiggyBac transposable element-derived protein domain-containing protein n=1 Tax=Planoprotostelium fungivorum TaxID=1890364 RepID=A0A2P6P0M5_9EUKA|nr:hypothetical protein PROFUN_00103 [Planoprotostelium fungivorum]
MPSSTAQLQEEGQNFLANESLRSVDVTNQQPNKNDKEKRSSSRVPPKPMSTVVPVGTRNSQTPANFFKRMLSPNILEEICRGSRQRYPIVAKTGKRENIQLDSSHYLKFAVAQLSEMVTFHKSQKELRDMLSGTSLSINKYNQIASYLHPPWETIWPMVNRNFETSIIPGGYATLDETMWAWQGEDPGIVCIERKPDGIGWKCITMAVKMAHTGRPYMLLLRPEVSEHFKPYECLDVAKHLANKYHLSVCADRWFGRMGWLETWCGSTFFTAGMKKSESLALYNVMTHKLDFGQYRVFRKGDLLISAFKDEAMMVVATSACSVEGKDDTSDGDDDDNDEDLLDDIIETSNLKAEILKRMCRQKGMSTGDDDDFHRSETKNIRLL